MLAASLPSKSLEIGQNIYVEWLKDLELTVNLKELNLEIEEISQLKCTSIFQIPENLEFCQKDKQNTLHQVRMTLKFEKEKNTTNVNFYPLNKWREYNRTYHEKYNIDLEEKLLYKASHLLGVPIHKIFIDIEDDCSTLSLWINYQYNLSRVLSSRCLMNIEEALITNQEIRNSRVIRSGSSPSKISQVAYQFFENKYPKFTPLERDNNYLNFVVDGLRGEVTKNPNQWEKLQISVTFQRRNEGVLIRLHSDGQVASGFTLPPLNSYRDMEPKYSQHLQIYTKSLLVKLENYLLAN